MSVIKLKLILEQVVNSLHHQISTARSINAAVVNISGRQRMLSQRIALFCLRLVTTSHQLEWEQLCHNLQAAIDLMERSHQGLIYGNSQMNLPGNPSETVQAMYFQAPLFLDQQVRQYLQQARLLLQTPKFELTLENPALQWILNAASTNLLMALDQVVSQYQKESEIEQQDIDHKLIELYRQSCTATATAQSHAQQLQKALYELQNTQAQLIQSEKMSSLGQLLAGVAHEINNPVTFIFGNLTHANNYIEDLIALLRCYQQSFPEVNLEIQDLIETIDLDFLLEDLPKVMTSMKIGADRIRQIVLSLRNFSRLDEAEMSWYHLEEGIENTLLILQNRLKPRAGYPTIHVSKEFGNIPAIECYAGQLNQVFMNLIANAIDALEEKYQKQDIDYNNPPQIQISTQQLHPQTILIKIADNGLGMTEDVKTHIFEEFFTTKPVGIGTGLGLSISYQIVVEKHQGTLQCFSKPGVGTEFWIELPMQKLQDSLSSKVSQQCPTFSEKSSY